MHLLCSGSRQMLMGISGEMPNRISSSNWSYASPGEERVSLLPLEDGSNTKDTATKYVLWGTPSVEDKPQNGHSKVSRNATEWHGAQTTSSSWPQVSLFSYTFGGTAYPTNVPYKNLLSRTGLPTLGYSQPLHSQSHHIIYEEFCRHWWDRFLEWLLEMTLKSLWLYGAQGAHEKSLLRSYIK